MYDDLKVVVIYINQLTIIIDKNNPSIINNIYNITYFFYDCNHNLTINSNKYQLGNHFNN